MPTTYHQCDEDVADQSRKLIQKYHPELIEADVTITYLYARNDKSDPLKHGGYPALALAKINNLRDRVAGLSDCCIMIDEKAWEDMDERVQDALLDHELMHFQVRRNDAGAIEYDDANRPLLKMKKHDFEIGGFHTIAKRYENAAIEVQAIEHVNKTWVQMELFLGSAVG